MGIVFDNCTTFLAMSVHLQVVVSKLKQKLFFAPVEVPDHNSASFLPALQEFAFLH